MYIILLLCTMMAASDSVQCSEPKIIKASSTPIENADALCPTLVLPILELEIKKLGFTDGIVRFHCKNIPNSI